LKSVDGTTTKKLIDPEKKKATKEEFEAILNEQIIMNVRDVHYNVIRNIAKKVFGWRCTRYKPDKETGSTKLMHTNADWDLIWIDSDFTVERLKNFKPHQKVNHFPGMSILALKNNLAKYLNLMQLSVPSEFGFFPKTWIFPSDSYTLMNYIAEKKKSMMLIVKPCGLS
jgi:tubulin polyglutamylase TTLL6/13